MSKRIFRAPPGPPFIVRKGTGKGKKPRNTVGAGSENADRKALVNWFLYQYPKLTIYIAKDELVQGAGNVHQGQRKGHPDIAIYAPAGQFRCLYIELKKKGISLRQRRDPRKWAKEHYSRQAEYLRILRTTGAAAVFAVGFEEAQTTILDYFAGENVNDSSPHKL